MPETMIDKMGRAAVTAGSGNARFWDEISEIQKEAWRVYMRAAVEAMREPSEAVLAQGEAAIFEHTAEPTNWQRDATLDGWQAVVDAIIAEKPDA